MYTQKLIITCLGPDGTLKGKEVCGTLKLAEDKTLVEVWVLADRLLMPKLQNLAIREMGRMRQQSTFWSLSACTLAYAKTQDGSALRRYLVDSHILEKNLNKSHEKKFPKEMLMDMVLRTLNSGLPNSIKDKLRAANHMEEFEVPEE